MAGILANKLIEDEIIDPIVGDSWKNFYNKKFDDFSENNCNCAKVACPSY